jgi:acetyl-CoA carboxylase carboxyl transferase subunit alpha
MTLKFLDFEKPIEELYEQLEKVKQVGEKSEVDVASTVQELEQKIEETRKQIFSNLSSWQRVQLSRHPNRPYTLAYIDKICNKFVELHGDRNVRDDKAMVGGLGEIDGKPIMFVGQQKGVNTKLRQMRNFGMPNPEGYRKALRLMKMAEKFNIPVVTFIDTPGAYPGLEAEERGQAEAIARNLFEMVRLRVPVLCIIIGEGASGGALGIGIGDRIFMFENAWYSVISPENCSTILWRSWDHKEQAAEQLKLTSDQMHNFGLIDAIIPEPVGGAHANYDAMSRTLKQVILDNLKELEPLTPEERIQGRIDKFSKMGFFSEEEPAKAK